MPKEQKNYSINSGSCITFLVFLFFMWAWLFGLPTHWGELEIDLFWPAIRLNGVTYLGK